MTADAQEFDVVVVGAGISGMYALHHFRELGFTVHVVEAGDGVGGTWYWNRYPGARCDVPSMEYSYGFSPDLEQEWEWTEVFPAQEELERYFNHVADRFDLRRDIQLGTRVTAATYDDASARWLVETDRGDRFSTQFLVMATGCLSAPLEPEIAGKETFAGVTLYTNAWPQDPPDLTGKRVGLIGTGSSGVQATPELARDAAELYVFQRTPSYAWPAGNKPLHPDLQMKVKAQYRELRKEQRRNYGGVVGASGAIAVPLPRDVAILEASPAERLAAVDELGWAACRAWNDVLRDLDANEAGADLYREMVRRVIDDPETADGLSPRQLPIGCKRPILHTDYYETFNLDHVHLVDLRRGGIEEITPTGITTAQGSFELDVIVFATGFDAMTGALFRIDIRGHDGLPLRDAWADGARTLLGVQTVGFPNFFTITGPGSPSVLANMVVCAEQHVEWIGDLLTYMRDHGHAAVVPTLAAQDAWVEEVNRVATGTMYTAPTCNSWYLGDNIPGKVRVFLPWVGGLPAYIDECDRVAAAGYEGFAFS
jgi:cyclohexanone monooxygenase